jgi:hypothetical protein
MTKLKPNKYARWNNIQFSLSRNQWMWYPIKIARIINIVRIVWPFDLQDDQKVCILPYKEFNESSICTFIRICIRYRHNLYRCYAILFLVQWEKTLAMISVVSVSRIAREPSKAYQSWPVNRAACSIDRGRLLFSPSSRLWSPSSK